MERARDAIRAVRGAEPLATGATVRIHPGIYPRSASFTLSAEDSGTDAAPVVYRAEPGGEAIFLGGRRFLLGDFGPIADTTVRERLPEAARDHVVYLDLRRLGLDDFGELPLHGHSMFFLTRQTDYQRGREAPELFVNDHPMTLARWPNDRFAVTGAVVEEGDIIRAWMDDMRTAERQRYVFIPPEARSDPPQGFSFRIATNRLAQWAEENDLRMHGYWYNNYSDQSVEVERVDAEKGILYARQPSAYGVREGQRFYVYNALSEIDRPGEWYLDRESGLLYLYPPVNDPEATVDLSMMVDPLLKVSNALHVRFEKLSFLATREVAVEISGGESVVLSGCRVGNTGGNGIEITGGHRHRVEHGTIFNAGAKGIRLEGGDRHSLTPGGHEAVHLHIHDYARRQKTYRAAIALRGVGQRAANNEINGAPHLAIGFNGNNHVIELNHIHDVCRETDDMAAIYSGRSWTSRGTIIRHNLIRNIKGYSDGTHRASGVYFDGGLSGNSVYGNVFLGVPQGIFFNGGRDNRAENNLMIDVENAMRGTDLTEAFQTWASAAWNTLHKDFEDSPYLSPAWREAYPQLSDLIQDEPHRAKNNVVRGNVRYNAPLIFGREGLRDEFVEVSQVKENPDIERRPGYFDKESGRFVPDPDSHVFSFNPGIAGIPFSRIGRLNSSRKAESSP